MRSDCKTQGRMDGCPEDHAMNWLDRETQERLYRQGQELLQRARRRAVNFPVEEDLRERKEKSIKLDTAFKVMKEYMDYISIQCGRCHTPATEKAALNHVCKYHQNQVDPMSSPQVRQRQLSRNKDWPKPNKDCSRTIQV
ncbi:A-kinase-interacting protein 1 isoform X7 [Antechinus flavipes]|uniref:A-kinase-interacting protein 1 isoform X7 n=1 Tax=Antechinus flavipes TaxID=38775 RepID=UPI002235A26D|nr:A-kinase-interacting protein 1 isoform X7 [Antechinus flavipes]